MLGNIRTVRHAGTLLNTLAQKGALREAPIYASVMRQAYYTLRDGWMNDALDSAIVVALECTEKAMGLTTDGHLVERAIHVGDILEQIRLNGEDVLWDGNAPLQPQHIVRGRGFGSHVFRVRYPSKAGTGTRGQGKGGIILVEEINEGWAKWIDFHRILPTV